MRIPLPNKLLDRLEKLWEPIGDWLNAPLYKRVRRIDVVIVILGIVCVGYYWLASGWQGALMATLMYTLMVMLALWFF